MSKGFGHFAGIRPREVMIGTIGALDRLLPVGLKPSVGRVTADGQAGVIECEGGAITTTGAPYLNQYCFFFTFAHDLIVHEYFCNRLADEVLWLVAPIEVLAARDPWAAAGRGSALSSLGRCGWHRVRDKTSGRQTDN